MTPPAPKTTRPPRDRNLINAVVPPGFFQQIEREYDAAMKALYP
jgi:hypothetical protein